VRIVAVGTGHEAFVYPVLERHGELGSNVGMAAVAKLTLHSSEQKFRRSRGVDRVAVGTHDIVLSME
jgi:hypothetical protein